MARQGTGTANFGGNVLNDVYLERFLGALKKRTGTIYPLGKKGTLPRGAGKKTRWQFMGAPTAVTANVAAEGDDPSDVNFTTATAEATLEEFGAVTPYSRLLAATAMSGTIEEIIDLLGYQAALSVEVRTISEVDGSTLTLDSGSAMTVDFLRQGAATLTTNAAFGNPATPGGMGFCFLGSTEAIYDMIGEGTPSWAQAKSRDIESALMQPLAETPATAAIYGCFAKYTQSIQRDTTPTPDDDLNLLIAGDAFGVSDLDFNASQPQVVVTPPEQSPHVPARNRGTCAWLLFYVSKLAPGNQRVVVIKSDATGT